MLASTTVHGTALGQSDFAQCCAACYAGQASPAVDIERLAEIAGAAVASGEVTQGSAARVDGFLQHQLDFIGESLEAWQRHFSGGAGWADTCIEQSLVGVNVADTHYYRGIHDEILYRHLPGLTGVLEVFAVKCGGKRLWTESAQQRVFRGSARMPEYAAEFSGIGKTHGLVVVEHYVDMVVPGSGLSSGHYAQASGHTQVNYQYPCSVAQQKILGTALDAIEAGASENPGQAVRYGPAKSVIANDNRPDGTMENFRCYSPARGFDFWQFWHSSIGLARLR